jgi:hypothetical protein
VHALERGVDLDPPLGQQPGLVADMLELAGEHLDPDLAAVDAYEG